MRRRRRRPRARRRLTYQPPRRQPRAARLNPLHLGMHSMLLPIAEIAWLHEMPTWLYNTAFPLNRWLHVVASALLVGGVLFLEFVVPLATADLKEEQQVAVFGRARWAYRKVVWFSG